MKIEGFFFPFQLLYMLHVLYRQFEKKESKHYCLSITELDFEFRL